MPPITIYFPAAMLIMSVAPWPYGYYTLLRFVATAAFAAAAAVAFSRKRQLLPWIYVGLALLCNPIVKVHLQKEAWVIVDIGAAAFLIITRKIIARAKT